MRLDRDRFFFIVAALAACPVAYACSGRPEYPRCSTNAHCSLAGKHDYCVAGTCVYCRDATDCKDREMCRSGRCLMDPGLQAKDGGADAAPDAAHDDEVLFTPVRKRKYYPSEE